MSRKKNVSAVGAAFEYGTHNMSFMHLTSLDFGRIQPIVRQMCVPNDEIRMSLCESVITAAPNAAPIQGKIKMHLAAFYVPCRVVWKDANKYFSGLENISIPSFELRTIYNLAQGVSGAQLTDRYAYHSAMGLPMDQCYEFKASSSATTSLIASILPYRAMQRVWWDWFRDSNVIPDSQASSYLKDDSNNENFVSFYADPKYACWPKNYITNTLRTPNGDSSIIASTNSTDGPVLQVGSTTNSNNSPRPAAPSTRDLSGSGAYKGSLYDPVNPGTSSVESLRMANAMQRFFESCNVLGGRVRDRLRGMFGSSVQPETLQMSEFLGQCEFDVNFETTASPSSTNVDVDTDFNAFGTTTPSTSTMKGQRTGDTTMTINGLQNINYHVKEHGYFFVVGWLLPEVMHYQGMSPDWLAGVDGIAPSRFDFPTKELVNTGFDPLLMYEVTLPNRQLTASEFGSYNPFSALGYRGKYESWKYNKDILSGCFADRRYALSMRPWWLGRDFLREAGVNDASGNWVTGKTGTDLNNGVTHNTLSAITRSTKQAYDDKFIISNSQIDHFVAQFNVHMDMVRPIPAITVPRIETATASPVEVGGTRL